MRVVFLEDVEGTADTGDVKNVADGFARNYLLPRKLAAPANGHYINIAQAKASKQARRQDRLDDEARAHLLPKVDGTTVRVEVRVGEQGKLFGSVTSRDIAEALREATKIEVEHQQVYLPQPLRELGSHEVTVKLTKNVHATVTVAVEPLGGVQEAETPAEAATEATAEPLVSETAAASEAQDADKRRQAEEGSQDTSAETGVGLEAGAEAAQVAAPQAVADVEAPDEQELEHTGEVD
ncbi:MAG: 50S ribosomal protein L9 [Chloroflexi bacterium]|nr:MAG: 50S ribosomal protein L9 [Chloroflexota bacterium]